LLAQIALCVLSPGFTPAILLAMALMIVAPICFLRSMPAHGIAFVLLPWLVGLLILQGLVLSPVFLVWLVLVVITSGICWNRGSRKPQWLKE
jgi:hypothetical protein